MYKKKQYRIKSIAKELQKEISFILLFKIRDPRLKGKEIIISDVQLSYDFSFAKVFIFCNFSKKKSILILLNNSVNFIKKIIKKKITLKKIPQIIFYYDNSMNIGDKINQLLKKVI